MTRSSTASLAAVVRRKRRPPPWTRFPGPQNTERQTGPIDMQPSLNREAGELMTFVAILERPVIEKILAHLGLDAPPAQSRGARCRKAMTNIGFKPEAGPILRALATHRLANSPTPSLQTPRLRTSALCELRQECFQALLVGARVVRPQLRHVPLRADEVARARLGGEFQVLVGLNASACGP